MKILDVSLEKGYIDSFRHLNENSQEYSWWAYYRNLRERNIGWRIDYVFISKLLVSELKDAFILKKVTGSDHCPVGIALDSVRRTESGNSTKTFFSCE